MMGIDELLGAEAIDAATMSVPVADGCECPGCGEANMDNLIWDDQDWVHCQSCGMVYDPATGEVL